ncbi:MAG: ATP synthase F0 subunit B [Proteobacteria bacterium]|nr:ATP synthase F0 subunit B [Pseudomonadota bacterium]
MELLRSIFAQIGINKTFYVQFVLIVVVYVFLSKMLFKPVLTILVTRKHKTLGLRKMAEDALMESDTSSEEFSKEWNIYEQKAKAIRNEGYEKNSKQTNEIIKEANRKAMQILGKRRSETATQIKDIEARLDKDVSQISDFAEKKLIGGGRA